MYTEDVIINVDELKAACFDLFTKGLSLEDGGRRMTDEAAEYYIAGMRKVFDLIEELGRQ